ncbi:DUF5930 domain-containing protein [Paracoccaceae bacterium Fryx2]|nr:DUF5930 domain-containing protein [Paracoccaceae bacterium Fryx2]
MINRLAYRINTVLERRFPEQRLFLKSDATTRFIRLRPATQVIALAGSTCIVAWTILATAILLMDSIGAGSARDQTQRQQALYESRLSALSSDRDHRAEEALRAQERFNLALAEVSAMQSRLLESEDQRKELETGIDVIQNTLRRTIRERDAAREDADRLTLALNPEGGNGRSSDGRAHDAEATIRILTGALGTTARQRDTMAEAAQLARDDTARVLLEKRVIEQRNDAIFSRLEEAVAVSMEPLDKMFRDAGMSSDALLEQVRKGYSGQGGPLMPLSLSTSGVPAIGGRDEARAKEILTGLDRMNLYRMAAEKAPFAIPIKAAFRFTSPFGYRNDPKGAGTRMHTGTDFAGPYGTPIFTTGDGVVTQAGWENGYGRMITVKHAFGIETRYAHLSQIRVDVGQRVSRGDRIGDMGNSGRSTGTHLHYEVRIGGTPVNPMTFIKAARDVF